MPGCPERWTGTTARGRCCPRSSTCRPRPPRSTSTVATSSSNPEPRAADCSPARPASPASSTGTTSTGSVDDRADRDPLRHLRRHQCRCDLDPDAARPVGLRVGHEPRDRRPGQGPADQRRHRLSDDLRRLTAQQPLRRRRGLPDSRRPPARRLPDAARAECDVVRGHAQHPDRRDVEAQQPVGAVLPGTGRRHARRDGGRDGLPAAHRDPGRRRSAADERRRPAQHPDRRDGRADRSGARSAGVLHPRPRAHRTRERPRHPWPGARAGQLVDPRGAARRPVPDAAGAELRCPTRTCATP